MTYNTKKKLEIKRIKKDLNSSFFQIQMDIGPQTWTIQTNPQKNRGTLVP